MILISGFPYVRERYFATWRHYPQPDDLLFLLPRRWEAKGGTVVFTPPPDANIIQRAAYFFHSHYPVIGGLLKGWMPSFVSVLWRHRHKVNLVYSCSEPTLLTTTYQALWAKILGKKHVCFSWENIPYTEKFHGMSRWVHLAILRVNLALSDGLICGNTAGVAVHRAYTTKPITVIPMNGLDPEAFRRVDTGDRPTHLSSRIVYTFVGAIGYRKGLHTILEALPAVLMQIPNAHVVIAGSGEHEAQIAARIEELHLQDHVTRIPWIDHKELVTLLSNSDVFLYPSIAHGGWAEQFGYSMAEASLMELPVIATRTGSIAEVVQDGSTGILVPPEDIETLAAAMVRLGIDASLREQMGRAGREYIASTFSHAIIAQRFYEFFRSI